MTGEFIAGKNLLHGDYVLPGGQSLPFGLIIKRLKRQQLLEKIMAGGEQRDTVTKQHHEACLRLQVHERDILNSCTCPDYHPVWFARLAACICTACPCSIYTSADHYAVVACTLNALKVESRSGSNQIAARILCPKCLGGNMCEF